MEKKHRQSISWIRFIPLTIILLTLSVFFYFDLHHYLTFSTLKQYRNILLDWTHQHYLLVSLTYIGVYIIVVAISIPGATILTLAGGFLFGMIFGTLFVITGATLGAIILFLAAKTALADLFLIKAGPKLQQMEKGFQKNALNYLLFLRLVPIFPFWLVNIVPALLNVRLKTFVIATFFGIMPGSFVYVLVGNGLSTVFAENKTPDLSIIFKPAIFVPLLGLAILSIVPIIYQKLKKNGFTH